MINPVEVELLLNNYPRIVVTNYFEEYLGVEWKGDLINVPQRVLVSKLAYRYVKWKVAWDEEFERLNTLTIRRRHEKSTDNKLLL